MRMLSVDGGGIRGLIPALLLQEIEQKKGKPIHELFDLIAGTSTGAIIAVGLTAPTPLSAERLVALYEKDGARIFRQWWLTRFLHIPPLRELFGAKYGESGRRGVLKEVLGDALLKAAKRRLFLTSYDTEGRMPVFFVSDPGDVKDGGDYFQCVMGEISMVDAALASSAAPTYFPPHRIRDFSLVDGGVFANNPTGLARGFMQVAGQDDLIVSLGTGSMERVYPYRQVRMWNPACWLSPVIKMMLDGQTESVAMSLKSILREDRYFRIQDLLGDVSDDLDQVSAQNIAAMKALAKKMIASPEFARMLDALW